MGCLDQFILLWLVPRNMSIWCVEPEGCTNVLLHGWQLVEIASRDLYLPTRHVQHRLLRAVQLETCRQGVCRTWLMLYIG